MTVTHDFICATTISEDSGEKSKWVPFKCSAEVRGALRVGGWRGSTRSNWCPLFLFGRPSAVVSDDFACPAPVCWSGHFSTFAPAIRWRPRESSDPSFAVSRRMMAANSTTNIGSDGGGHDHHFTQLPIITGTRRMSAELLDLSSRNQYRTEQILW